MNKQEKVEYLIEELQKLYPNPKAPLNYTTHFTLLVAVLLSAQSTDKKVNEITPPLFQLADNALAMSKLSIAEIKEYIQQIGLSNNKAKFIKQLSDIIVEKYNNSIPETLEELEKLPGVGHKTASVVVAECFGIPAFPVDTHIHRLMYRWGLSNGTNVVQTEKDAKRLFPKEKWNSLHLQIIFYGREYSPAKGWKIEKDFITSKIGRKSLLK